MASKGIHNVIYPGNGFSLLDGGLDTKYEKAIIADNESPDCLNIVFKNGAVETRGGTSKLNTTTAGTFVCDGLYVRRDDDGSETMIAFHGGTARYLTTGGTTFITIGSGQSVFTAGIRVCAAQYRDNIFFGNGGIIPYKYNGTDWTRHGVYPLTNTASFVSTGAGNVQAGVLSYKFTALNSYLVESDLSNAVTITATNSSTIGITSIPVVPQSWGVSSRRIYRSSGATYNLVTTLNDNTTTTYNDSTQTPTSSGPSDNGVPPKYSVCIYHANRLFVNDAANGNYVWYSEVGQPFTFQSDSFFKVGDASSDLVKGFDVFDNALVVRCENSVVLNYMEDAADDTTWRQFRVRASVGSRSPFGSWFYDNKVGFVAIQNTKLAGFAALSGDTIDPSATFLTVATAGSNLISDRIEPDVFAFQSAYVGNISAIVYKNRAYIAVTYGAGATTNNRIYLFDFSISNLAKKQTFAWSAFSGVTPAQFAIYGGNLYYGSSSTDGFIYQLDTSSYVDVTTAIDSYYWTKEFSGNAGHENYIKDFRKLRILVDLAGLYYMNITYRVDSDSGTGNTAQIYLDPGTSVWNNFLWGMGMWGGGQGQKEFEIPLGSAHGKRIQFKFSNQNTANQRFKVHRLSFTYNIRGLGG